MDSTTPPPRRRSKFLRWFVYFTQLFDLQEGKEDELETIEYISKNVEFKGANLWILIFAIFVASVGLNVNSTAVIIGAMLISPLMGPIMGIGMAAGINDFDLLKRSFRNLGVAVFISILTSTIYFAISPISTAQSELLARTEPTVWDVLIALFGGLAGIVAGSRKEKSNAIPGVAIATALMPPLCTAGYGLATGNLLYFVGAFYLFFINSVFISLSTYLIVRFMRYPKKQFLDSKREKRVQTYITIITLATIIPSVYLAYRIVKKSLWNEQARNFIALEIQFPKTQVLTSEFHYLNPPKTIEVSLIGEPLSAGEIASLRAKLPAFGLDETTLTFVQSGNGTDLNLLRNDILKDLYERNEALIRDKDEKIALLENEILADAHTRQLSLEIAEEARVNHPNLKKFSMGRALVTDLEKNHIDTLLAVYAEFVPKASPKESDQLSKWLKVRAKADTIALILH